jgi:hypothetical protein
MISSIQLYGMYHNLEYLLLDRRSASVWGTIDELNSWQVLPGNLFLPGIVIQIFTNSFHNVNHSKIFSLDAVCTEKQIKLLATK